MRLIGNIEEKTQFQKELEKKEAEEIKAFFKNLLVSVKNVFKK